MHIKEELDNNSNTLIVGQKQEIHALLIK